MKKHLTDLSIQRQRAPREGQLEVFDLGYPGLALRIGHGGAKSFVLFHRQAGKLTRTTLGRWPRVSLADARNAWRAVAEGKAPMNVSKTDTTKLVSKVVEEWLKLDVAPRSKASSLRALECIVDHDIVPAWGNKRIDEISKPDVNALIDGIVARGAPIKARRVHTAIGRMFKWSVGRGIITTTSPMEGLSAPGKEKPRGRVLSDDELAKVWRVCDGVAGSVVKMLILTGARREEIGQLRWSEIEGDQIILSNGRTKTGVAHIIPLSAPAQALLASVPRIEGSDYVFTLDGLRPVSGWTHVKKRVDQACGVTGWTIHDLRRTCATGMQRLGIGLQTVEAVLGHVSGSRGGIVGVYQKYDFASEKKAALEAWGKYVLGTNRQQ